MLTKTSEGYITDVWLEVDTALEAGLMKPKKPLPAIKKITLKSAYCACSMGHRAYCRVHIVWKTKYFTHKKVERLEECNLAWRNYLEVNIVELTLTLTS